ncbi:MAG: virulence RhuM family protein [Bacteroidales bacterium]|nr:virulence RhuM family protein [Bacteroidales bacterium]
METNIDKNGKGEIILYQPDDNIRLEVRMEGDTVWLTQQQMAELFGTTRNNITLHIANIFKEGELARNSVCKDFLHTASDGKCYKTKIYNLDVIISVGYRVKSVRGTQFRIWANKVLKEYLLRGYSINQRFLNIEQRIDRQLQEHAEKIHSLEEQVGFFVRTALPPVQGVFYDGQIFDAYTFASDLIRSARERIILIDNYVDDSVLKMLTKRGEGVSASIVTKHISETLALDIERHNQQYPPVEVLTSNRFHDRFIILDDTVYHLGASLKDLGKKLFAFCRMDIKADILLNI